MTSVQKFLRQRYVPNTILQAPTNACYYVFIPTAGNYVGNYPPGYVQLATTIPVTTDPLSSQGSLIRDMGKTIKCPISADGVTFGSSGFFREVQVLNQNAMAVATATSSVTFGVGTNSNKGQSINASGNAGDRGYGTYYIPIVVEGTLASGATLPTTYLPLGGQM